MRPKQQRIVLAFFSTAAALEFESKAETAGFTGRLFPVPSSITAGCGLAWQESMEHSDALRLFLQEHDFGEVKWVEMLV